MHAAGGLVIFLFIRRLSRHNIQALDQRGAGLQHEQIHLTQPHLHPRATHETGCAGHAEHERNFFSANQAFFHDRGCQLSDTALLHVAHGPVALHAVLEGVVGGVRRIKAADDAKQLGIFGFEGRRQSGGHTVARASNDLPLIDQISVTTQGRSAPCIAFHADTRMR